MKANQIVKQIQDDIRPLRIRGLLKKRSETLQEFLEKFFRDWNNDKDTIYVGNGHLQTEPGKRRSIGDIFQICQYYFPDCTIKEVSDILLNKLPDTVSNFRTSYCNMIHKRVFYKGEEDQETGQFDEEDEDEYGMTLEDWEEL